MKKLAIALLSTPVMAEVISKGGGPAVAQSNPITSGKSEPLQGGVNSPTMPPPPLGAIADTIGQPIRCKPTGITASGELVYGMSCKDIPVSVTYPTGRLPGSGQSGFSGPPNITSGSTPPNIKSNNTKK